MPCHVGTARAYLCFCTTATTFCSVTRLGISVRVDIFGFDVVMEGSACRMGEPACVSLIMITQW